MRMSTAVTYLAQARPRPNLTLCPETVVSQVACSGSRATGIRLLDGTLVDADRVVLAAGTYSSPMILARSGIGPADELRALGITPVVDLPGVGRNLSDHPLVSVDLPTRPLQARAASRLMSASIPARRTPPGLPICCCSAQARSTSGRIRARAAPCSELLPASWRPDHVAGFA